MGDFGRQIITWLKSVSQSMSTTMVGIQSDFIWFTDNSSLGVTYLLLIFTKMKVIGVYIDTIV